MAGYNGHGEFGLVILLLGPKLSGKSSVGNAILGRQAFGNDTMCSSKTTGFTFGKQVTVVDTPGWRLFVPSSEHVPQELQRALSLCGPQLDVVLLVHSVLTRLGPVQWDAMESQLRRLSIRVWEKAIVLFTHADCLGKLTIEEHIRREGRALQSLLGRCGNRYHVLHGNHRHGTPQTDVQQLHAKMQWIREASRSPGLNGSVLGNQEQIEMRRWANPSQYYNPPQCYDVEDGGTNLRLGQRQWSLAGISSRQSISKSPLSIVLLGRRKSGKSSVGNSILAQKKFKTDTKTSRSTAGQGLVSGAFVTVVDTPGWSFYGLAKSEKVLTEISQSYSLCSTGSKCVFLLVIPIDSFKEKDLAKVEKYVSVLGNNIWRKMLVLFTFGDELKDKSIEEHVTKQGQDLQWLMQKCGHRHHVIETSVRDSNQLEQLMEKIQEM